jgi:hypothetical protein
MLRAPESVAAATLPLPLPPKNPLPYRHQLRAVRSASTATSSTNMGGIRCPM